MERDKIRNKIVKMVDSLIGEVLNERKSEFDIMKEVVKRKKKGFIKQKKMIVNATNYVVKEIPQETTGITLQKGHPVEQIAKVKKKKKWIKK